MNRKEKNTSLFVGREASLAQLESLTRLNCSSLAVIRGRRRIGKSRLVYEFARERVFYSFAGIAPVPGLSAQDQRDAFARKLAHQFNFPPFTFQDWADGFDHLSKNLTSPEKNGDSLVILFDEISWMGSQDPTFLPKLKDWWDQMTEARTDVILILCGSVSTWIEKNLIESTAFFGRISLHLTLEPLSLTESFQFLKAQGVQASSYEIFRILSITGGIPWYLENIQPNETMDENIRRLCFFKDGLLVKEFELIFHDLFDRKGEIYKKIVQCLSNGLRDYQQIREALNYPAGGGLTPYLEALVISGYVTQHPSWSIKSGKTGTKTLYRLSDNYLRFYLKVTEPILGKIALQTYHHIPLSALPGWNSLMGIQFENLLLSNRTLLLKLLGIALQDVEADGPFLQRQTQAHPSVQIDYLVQTATKTLYICEIKFSRNEINSSVIDELKRKIDSLAIPRGFSAVPVLFHFGPVADIVAEAGYFYRIINIDPNERHTLA